MASFKNNPGENLGEALDGNYRPLCILPFEDIIKQKLLHRSIALLLTDRRKKILLNIDPDGIYGFSFSGALQAGFCAREYAEKMALEHFGSGNLTLLGEIHPCIESGNSVSSIFSISASNALANAFALDRERWLLADPVEILSLMNFGCEFSPLFRLFFQNYLNT